LDKLGDKPTAHKGWFVPVKRRKAPPAPLESAPETKPVCSCKSSPLATVEEAASYLRVSTRTIRDLKHAGVLRLVPHFGKDPDAKPWRFLYADLDRHIEEMKKAA
jgi:excisionase family DNA binding protein